MRKRVDDTMLHVLNKNSVGVVCEGETRLGHAWYLQMQVGNNMFSRFGQTLRAGRSRGWDLWVRSWSIFSACYIHGD
eukprot:1182614-Prorocentrum_minimum.AAC.3